MSNANLHKDVNGIIKKVRRKPKRSCDHDLLKATLVKHKIPDGKAKAILDESSRKEMISEYISVKSFKK